MPRYRFSFSEEQYGYIYFDADSKEEAEALLDQVREYEIDPEDIPSVHKKTRDGQCEYYGLEEVK